MSKILVEMIRNIVNDLSLSNHKLNPQSHVKNTRKLKDQNTRKLN